MSHYQGGREHSKTRTDYLWHGDVLLAEQKTEQPLSRTKTTIKARFDNPDVVYIHRPGTFEPLMQIRPPSERAKQNQIIRDGKVLYPLYSQYYYVNDHLGTPQELLDRFKKYSK